MYNEMYMIFQKGREVVGVNYFFAFVFLSLSLKIKKNCDKKNIVNPERSEYILGLTIFLSNLKFLKRKEIKILRKN